MDFISNGEEQIAAMLQELDIASVDELFAEVSKELQVDRPAGDDGISEYEGLRHMEYCAQKNSFHTYDSYLGCGAYEHHIPAIVNAVISKSEFLTSYTPYQAEASQGILQATFEFQTAICALTGLDVANASLYDGASGCAEAVLMALRLNGDGKNKVLISASLHPTYRKVVELYLGGHKDAIIELLPFDTNGILNVEEACSTIDTNTIAVIAAYPNIFGGIDDLRPIFARAKDLGALAIVSANPMVYGIYSSAAVLGADIAVGDCQPFGIAMNYGGPYAGYIACRSALVRQLPGRIVGSTYDGAGKRGFVLTLQAREQHIRREKATSNICTNQALMALAALVSMLWYGKRGVRELALTNYQRAAYLRHSLAKVEKVKVFGGADFFNEFAVDFGVDAETVLHHFRKHGIEPGVRAVRWYPQLENAFIVAVTETKNKEQLNKYIAAANVLSTG